MTEARELTAEELAELKILAHRDWFYRRQAAALKRKEIHDSGCNGKVRFATWDLAKDLRDRRGRMELKRHIYRCQVCQGYHLGERFGTSQRLMDRRPRAEL